MGTDSRQPRSDLLDLAGLPRLDGTTPSFVTLADGLRMHVAQAGDLAADPVLLLHGFPQHWWEWRKVIPHLAQDYRVIAPDLRGAGWTDAPADGYTVAQITGDVLALLDALGLERVRLVAHDFSAFVGYRLCFEHPERVAAFLCLGPHPYLRVRPHMLAGMPQLWFQPVVATPGLGPRALRTRGLARHLLAGFGTTPDSFTPGDLEAFTCRLHADRHPEAGSALYRHLILPEMRRMVATRAYRGRLTVPTVALMGAAEPGVRLGDLDVHGDVADDLAGHLVEGAAHFLADDRPDAVVAHARELFARVT